MAREGKKPPALGSATEQVKATMSMFRKNLGRPCPYVYRHYTGEHSCIRQ